MSSNIAVGLFLFLGGGILGILFLVARTRPEVESGEVTGSKRRHSSDEIGKAVLLAVAVIGLFAAVIGLFLLVDALG